MDSIAQVIELFFGCFLFFEPFFFDQKEVCPLTTLLTSSGSYLKKILNYLNIFNQGYVAPEVNRRKECKNFSLEGLLLKGHESRVG